MAKGTKDSKTLEESEVKIKKISESVLELRSKLRNETLKMNDVEDAEFILEKIRRSTVTIFKVYKNLILMKVDEEVELDETAENKLKESINEVIDEDLLDIFREDFETLNLIMELAELVNSYSEDNEENKS